MITYKIMGENFRTIGRQYKKLFRRGIDFKKVKEKWFSEDEDIRNFLSTKHKVPLENIYIDEHNVFIAENMYDIKILEMMEMDRSNNIEKETIDLKIKVLDKEATVPENITDRFSYFNIFACEDKIVISGDTLNVRTGISMEFPKGYNIQLYPYTTMSLKYPGYLANGTEIIHHNHDEEIVIPIFNNTNDWLRINKGNILVQGIIVKVNPVEINIVSTLGETSHSDIDEKDEPEKIHKPEIKSCDSCNDICKETCFNVCDNIKDITEEEDKPWDITKDFIGAMEWKKCKLLWYMGLFDEKSIDFLAKEAAKEKLVDGTSPIHLIMTTSNGIADYIEKYYQFNKVMKDYMIDISDCGY